MQIEGVFEVSLVCLWFVFWFVEWCLEWEFEEGWIWDRWCDPGDSEKGEFGTLPDTE